MQQGVQNPDVLSLAAGLVDPATLPVAEVGQSVEELLRGEELARTALQYGTTAGADRLRRHLIEHLARLENCAVGELGIDVDQLILTTGSQQFLSLITEVLVDPGDIVFVAAPTYFAYLGVLNGVGAKAIPIPADGEGMRIDLLDAALEQVAAAGDLPRVKMIYVVSWFENPTGVCLSAGRRQKLVEVARRWSREHRIVVLEDAAYRELNYSGPEIPSVFSFDRTHESVVLTQTFSKSFSPGLRVGFSIVPKELVGPICDRKGNEDFGSANFNQHLLATMFEKNVYAEHVQVLRKAYTAKRDAMLAAAERYFGALPGVEWIRPNGGLYVWMTLPPKIKTGLDSDLFARAVKSEKVMYVPGEFCYAGPLDSRPQNQMRLSFGVLAPAAIDEGMRRIARAVSAFSG